MNFEQYRAIDAINFSALKSMKKSPLQFKYDLDNGRSDSVGKALGRATHTAVLEPHKFNDEYAIYDGKTRRGKDWDLFEKENSRKTILKREEAEHCIKIAKVVRANPVAKHYLSKGKAEHTIEWSDKKTGLKCKARLDFLSEVDDKLTIVDLKGCSNVQAEIFRVEAGKQGYHRQLGYYQSGIEQTCDGQTADCVIIAVEYKAPHDVAVFKLEEDALFAGFSDCEEFLQKVAVCKTNNDWPGCYQSIQDLVLRKWETGLGTDDDAGDLGLEFVAEDE